MSRVYYNEIDPFAAEWLRQLMVKGMIPKGEVDERSIEDIQPRDLDGFDQCHFFAGIGVWAYALARAGWGDRPVWTGSCPCQPFSTAGKGLGFADERHLWPAFRWLIKQQGPDIVLGEQVAAKAGELWLDHVSHDLEAEGFSVGSVVFPACGVGAPHLRQRQYWVAHSEVGGKWSLDRESRKSDGREIKDRGRGLSGRLADGEIIRRGQINQNQRGSDEGAGEEERPAGPSLRSGNLGMADSQRERLEGHSRDGDRSDESRRIKAHEAGSVAKGCDNRRMANAIDCSRQPEKSRATEWIVSEGDGAMQAELRPTGPTNGFWGAADWLLCRDGKWRPVQPGTFPLANGVAARVGRLRGYGNAIVAPQAQEFSETVIELLHGRH